MRSYRGERCVKHKKGLSLYLPFLCSLYFTSHHVPVVRRRGRNSAQSEGLFPCVGMRGGNGFVFEAHSKLRDEKGMQPKVRVFLCVRMRRGGGGGGIILFVAQIEGMPIV